MNTGSHYCNLRFLKIKSIIIQKWLYQILKFIPANTGLLKMIIVPKKRSQHQSYNPEQRIKNTGISKFEKLIRFRIRSCGYAE